MCVCVCVCVYNTVFIDIIFDIITVHNSSCLLITGGCGMLVINSYYVIL